MQSRQDRFWENKKLAELTSEEWELICDGCARCCVHKIRDNSTGKTHYTNVACRYLDTTTCTCTCYEDRKKLVPECTCLLDEDPADFGWLPPCCSYRLLSEGKSLPTWHPLIEGDAQSTCRAGMSVRNHVISEEEAGALRKHIMYSVEAVTGEQARA
jgi:uncharacterized cysteine cluster protein YcgN (CxxCxxCC family)